MEGNERSMGMNTRLAGRERNWIEDDDDLSSLQDAVVTIDQIITENSAELDMSINEYLIEKNIPKSHYRKMISKDSYASRSIVYEFASKIVNDIKSIRKIMNLYGYALRLEEVEQLRIENEIRCH